MDFFGFFFVFFKISMDSFFGFISMNFSMNFSETTDFSGHSFCARYFYISSVSGRNFWFWLLDFEIFLLTLNLSFNFVDFELELKFEHSVLYKQHVTYTVWHIQGVGYMGCRHLWSVAYRASYFQISLDISLWTRFFS